VGLLLDLEGDLLSELRKRSTNQLYQRDPEAWLWDVLGKRWWSKQREVAWSFWGNPKTLVKSANGVGKSQLAGDLGTWFATVHPPEETVVMISAPVRNQIDEVLFRYLRENYSLAAARKMPFIGEITRWPKWKTTEPYDIDIVVPRRPSDANLLAAFQGIHNTHVAVILDEAGGLQEDFYIGADAVTTQEHARILGIGNPDRRNTAFHKRFVDREAFIDWNLFTIAATDTPNFTGEILFPDDLEMDLKVKSKMIKVGWVAMMRRSALPGVVAAKVDGEFPKENEDAFFAQTTIDAAHNAELTPELGSPVFRYLGVDIAYTGADKSMAYLNVGGHIRKVHEWDKINGVEFMDQARLIHRLAKQLRGRRGAHRPRRHRRRRLLEPRRRGRVLRPDLHARRRARLEREPGPQRLAERPRLALRHVPQGDVHRRDRPRSDRQAADRRHAHHELQDDAARAAPDHEQGRAEKPRHPLA
jgi:hypothetical protein